MANPSSAGVAGNIATAQGNAGTGVTTAAPKRLNRISVTLINHSATDIFFGDPLTLSAANGAKLVGVVGASVTLPYYGDLGVITAAGNAAYSVIENF